MQTEAGFSGRQDSMKARLACTPHRNQAAGVISEASTAPGDLCRWLLPSTLPRLRFWAPEGERGPRTVRTQPTAPPRLALAISPPPGLQRAGTWLRSYLWPRHPSSSPSLSPHAQSGRGPFVSAATKQACLPRSLNPPGASLSCKAPFALFASRRSALLLSLLLPVCLKNFIVSEWNIQHSPLTHRAVRAASW